MCTRDSNVTTNFCFCFNQELNIKERSVLMRLEEDVKSEFNLEKRRRKAKEDRARRVCFWWMGSAS